MYWSYEQNSGNVVSTSATDSNANNTCGPTYKPVNPNYSPNPGPITVYSQYVHTQNIIKIVFSSNGSYVGSSGMTTEQCI